MTAETQATPAPAASDLAATGAGGVDRLNAFDGLFLRPEHLITMQDYARDLALAVGQAGGPRTVGGYCVALGPPGDTREIAPGLAVDENGRPLRSTSDISLPLTVGKAPALTENGFWWIEILAARWPHGDAEVTGTLCDEPCGGGTSKQLYLAEGVQARLVPDARPGLDGVPAHRRRNWLAGTLFADEEADAQGRGLTTGGGPPPGGGSGAPRRGAGP